MDAREREAPDAPEQPSGGRKFRKRPKGPTEQSMQPLNAWERYTQALMLKNEFIFVR